MNLKKLLINYLFKKKYVEAFSGNIGVDREKSFFLSFDIQQRKVCRKIEDVFNQDLQSSHDCLYLTRKG